MNNYIAFRVSEIRYWEWRRIAFNLSLILPAALGYLAVGEISAAVGDRHNFGLLGLFVHVLVAACGANICYTFSYVLAFLCGSDEASSLWLRFGRRSVFVSGTLFAMLVAFVGGRTIALMQYAIQ